MNVPNTEITRSFRAMNTDVQAVIVTCQTRAAVAAEDLGRVEAVFQQAELRLSRFNPDSELCALNESAGRPFSASPILFEAVSAAVQAAEATDGLFDPTILRDLVAAGYNRSFELLPPCAERISSISRRRPSWRRIEVDPTTSSITLPPGCSLDLGGIGKGWTLDHAAALLGSWSNCAIDAGGDMVLRGTQAGGAPWSVGVQNPLSTRNDIATLECTDCAVATSTVACRRWIANGRPQHHIIDPRTGRPATTGVLAATVIAETAARAETLTKAALLLGPGAGIRFLNRLSGVNGLLVLDGGYVQRSPGLSAPAQVA